MVAAIYAWTCQHPNCRATKNKNYWPENLAWVIFFSGNCVIIQTAEQLNSVRGPNWKG